MVTHPTRLTPPVQCVPLHDPESRLEGVIVIHSTALGPGAGGCRFWSYPDMDRARADALRLAEGMSYKNALAGLPLGGAKAVLRRPEGDFDRARLFHAFGKAVAELRGTYVTAEDVGTSVADMQDVARATRHVAGLPARDGRAGGDPSPWTAQGVFESIREAAAFALERDLGDLTVAVQGVGHVGADLCRRLAEAGARLVVADVDPDRCENLRALHGAKVVDVDAIVGAEADVFAPCALGGVLDARSAQRIAARLVCGAANNQLARPEVAETLRRRGIAYVPDYVANAGGIISVSAEYLGEDAADVGRRVAAIAPRVVALLERAAREGRSPAAVADDLAEEVIAGARRPATAAA
ncbi:Glu/Leu/Phe/Val dehydrogenase dimerization domain-containing protein [Pelagerythrobacter marensis]|uniref:Glu/Leu/Phe/Val dehydrogenase dimerization domain-containing protein n=1 Tax=Pelagerythrobacter marensis TaxID=543877 RepID=A0ABZ2DDP9_9SPHN